MTRRTCMQRVIDASPSSFALNVNLKPGCARLVVFGVPHHVSC